MLLLHAAVDLDAVDACVRAAVVARDGQPHERHGPCKLGGDREELLHLCRIELERADLRNRLGGVCGA